MPRLSNSDSRTIRHTREAVELLISGAMRHLESDYGPNDDSDRSFACDALLLHVRESLDEWMTAHEMGDRPQELTNDDTALQDD